MEEVGLEIRTPIVTPEQIDLVRRTVAKDATPDELQLFFFDCQRQGVHPLDKLIHFTKRNGKYTPITSIDFMRSRAADTGEHAGTDDPIFTGEPKHEEFAATASVYRMVQGQRCAFTATARWSEYKPAQNDFMWQKMPHTMLGKCAEALALRKGFPKQLAGLYAREEMAQAESGRGKEQEAYAEAHPEIDWQDVVDKIAAAKNAEQFNACIPLVDDYIASVPEAVNKIAAKDYFAGKAREKGFRWNRDERRFVPDEQSATDLTPALQASVKALADKKAMEAQTTMGSAPKSKQNPNTTITEKQFGRLWAIAKSAGFDETQVRELAGAHGWEGHLKEMTAGIYDKVCADLQTYVTPRE